MDAFSEAVATIPGQRFLEESLNLSVRELLPVLQERIVERTTYFGIPAIKSPLDFWIYQELICSILPDVVVEIGNFRGGTLLALAHWFDALGSGRVIGIDCDQKEIAAAVRAHPRITLIEGDAVENFSRVREEVGSNTRVLVIEDSSHTFENTLAILKAYSDLVSPGSYFIVEDGICHHGLEVGPSPGPYEAITDFMCGNTAFVIDRACEAFLLTWNPRGFLRRVE
ncbi:MAG: hypothetical protein DLM73_00415 [Chthoniobacterales bacterium]|nr:MAG: hypothetical protein DLM73_00415 [Chthoniobacterales bacterium]